MSNPSVATEQLLELLLTLKKTTPQAACNILNAQPAIAYALITLMVSMNAISIEVFQRSLAEFGAGAGHPTLPDPSSSKIPMSTGILPMTSAAPIPISAVPPHFQAQYRGVTPPIAISTPPPHTPTPPYGYSHPSAVAQPSNGSYGGYNGYPSGFSTGTAGGSLPPTQSGMTPGITEALANIPPEQKALILRVITMTPEHIRMLPPAERATYIQIRTTLGIPTDQS